MIKTPKKIIESKKRVIPPERAKEKVELVDPVLYRGGLEENKYPFLALEKKEKPEEEIENPLNKR
jgi:hypothetical protein